MPKSTARTMPPLAPHVLAALDASDPDIARQVRDLRADGWSWSAIGDALGLDAGWAAKLWGPSTS